MKKGAFKITGSKPTAKLVSNRASANDALHPNWRCAVGAILSVWALAVSGPTLAGPLDRPDVSVGDSWVYDTHYEKGATKHDAQDEFTILRSDGHGLLVSIRDLNSGGSGREQLFGLDWSRFRSVNGAETVVNQPLAFPLAPNKAWTIAFTERNPDPKHVSQTVTLPYRATGWEEVTAPAGTFHAVKIEVNGTWVAETAPQVFDKAIVGRNGSLAEGMTNRSVIAGKVFNGRIYKAFWYAPEVKRWVRSIEEWYSSDGARTESVTSELESYRLNGVTLPQGRQQGQQKPAPAKPSKDGESL
jgi:hypothetical protein